MMRQTTRLGVVWLALTVGAATALVGAADDGTDVVKRVNAGGPLESGPDDPPGVRSPLATAPRALVRLGGFTSVQANVDGGGNNIIGDAANEPSIGVDPTAPNRMAVGWRQFDTIASNFRQAGYAYSRDGGRTWSGQQIIEPGVFRSDPVLTVGDDGTFYYLSLSVNQSDFLCDVFMSTDGGATWPTQTFAYGGDKAWFVIDPTDGIGAGNQYGAWNTAGNMFFPAQFSRSVDGGATWNEPSEYEPSGGVDAARPVFGILDVGPDGEVYVAGSRNSANTDDFWVVRSDSVQNPQGLPVFETIRVVDLGGNLRIGAGPNPAGLLGQVNVAVNRAEGPMRGDVYVLCAVDPPGADPMDIHFIRSTDGGDTWSAPVKVNDDEGVNAWQWFGTMSVAPNGRIDVVWNDHRDNAPANDMAALYYASSTDGGVTWSPNVALSPVFDTHVGWPQQNKLGDYYDMESDDVGAHLIWAATFNGEQDVYYLRIGDYDCNGNGIGDADDLVSGFSADCDANGIPDECEIAAGVLLDSDGDGIPNICDDECLGDIVRDGAVNTADLLELLGDWGPCPAPCPSDLDGDGAVTTADLLGLLAVWGPCPGA